MEEENNKIELDKHKDNLERVGETAVSYNIDETKTTKSGDEYIERVCVIQVPKIIKKSGIFYNILEDNKKKYKKIILVNHDNSEIAWNVYEAEENKKDISIFASSIIKEFAATSAWRNRLKYVANIEDLFLHPKSIEKYAVYNESNITNAFGFRNKKYYGVEYNLEYDVTDPIAKHIEKTIKEEKTFCEVNIDHSKITSIIKEVNRVCENNTNGYYVLGWSLMSMCRLDILDEFQIFPTLGLFGIKSGGKSTLGTLFISNLWGNKKQESQTTLEGTGVRFEPLKGSTKPVSVDEAKKINFEILRELSTSKYISRKRGTRTGHVLERDLMRPIAINGNEIIFPKEDGSAIISANLSRFQFLKFNKIMKKDKINLSYEDMMMLGRYIIENILPGFNMDRLIQLKKGTKTSESRNAEVVAIREYGIELVKELFQKADIVAEIPSFKEVNIEDFAKTPGKQIYDTLFTELEKVTYVSQHGLTTWRDVAFITSQKDKQTMLQCNNMAIMKKLENKGMFYTLEGELLLTKQSTRTLGTIGTMKTVLNDLEESQHGDISFAEYVMKGEERSIVEVNQVQGNKIIHVKKTGIVLHFNNIRPNIEDSS